MFDIVDWGVMSTIMENCDDATKVSLILTCTNTFNLFGKDLGKYKPVTVILENCNFLFSRTLDFYYNNTIWKKIIRNPGFEECWFKGKRKKTGMLICRKYAAGSISYFLSLLNSRITTKILDNSPLLHNSIKIFSLFVCNKIVPKCAPYLADFKRLDTVYLCFNESDGEYHYINNYQNFIKNWKKPGIGSIINNIIDEYYNNENESSFEDLYHYSKEKRRSRLIINKKFKN